MIIVIVATSAASFVVFFLAALTFLNLVGFAAAFAVLRWPGLGVLGIGILCVVEPISGPLLAQGGLWRWNNFNYWLLVVLVLSLPLVIRLKYA